MKRMFGLGLTAILAIPGCNPRVIVSPNPAPMAKGIRYYRPKPYLFVMPATKTEGEGKYVNIEVKYLPDFEEEYVIDIRSGLGVNNTKVELENGWNLTSINEELDSKTAEKLDAIAKIVAATVPVRVKEGERPVSCDPSIRYGVYEAVLARDAHGKKHLTGWRYLGADMFAATLASCGALPSPVSNSGNRYDFSIDDQGMVQFGSDAPRADEVQVEAVPGGHPEKKLVVEPWPENE